MPDARHARLHPPRPGHQHAGLLVPLRGLAPPAPVGGALASPAARIAGAALLLLAWLALVQDLHRLAAAFVLGTTLMLALAVLPYAGALIHARRTP